MKKQLSKYMLAGIFSLGVLFSFSQQQARRAPAWVSEKGYWVVESNASNPFQHSIRFYNNEDQMIGRKELSGVRLNPRKRKVKMKLKEFLESSILAWEQGKKKNGEPAWVKMNP